jgi:DNA-binding transcriptional ArsR family regulator
MPSRKIELFLHPIRLRILQTLVADTLTTQEIADRLPDVPKSSIYRHLKILLDAGLLAVADTRPVKGVEEKVYRLARMPRITNEDAARLTPDDLVRYCTTFLVAVLHGFSNYTQATPHPDMARDLAGFTETIFYATDAEFTQAIMLLQAAIVPLTTNGPGGGRRRRKLATVTHPVPDPPPASRVDGSG